MVLAEGFVVVLLSGGGMVRTGDTILVSKMLRLTSCRFAKSISSRLVYSEEVFEALSNQKPIVALESTVITHGLPAPHNFE